MASTATVLVAFRLWVPRGLYAALACVPLVAQAGPPVSCSAAAERAHLRATGVSELLPDILVRCVASGATAGNPSSELRIDVAVDLNVGVTSPLVGRVADRVTSAELVVNEGECATAGEAGSQLGACSTVDGAGTGPHLGRASGATTLRWAGISVPFPESPNPAELTLRIRGVHANVSQVRLAAGGPPVRALLEIRTATAAIHRESLEMGLPLPGIGYAAKAELAGRDCAAGALGAAVIHLWEGFAGALRSAETHPSGAAASRVMLTFGDLPNGVGVRVPDSVACHQPGLEPDPAGTADALQLALVSGHDEAGSGGSSSPGSGASVSLTVEDGAASAVYEVVADDSGQLEDCHVVVAFDSQSSRAGSAAPSIRAELAPRSAETGSSADAPLPRFAPSSSPAVVPAEYKSCRSILLFPFVTSQAGFDTGLIVAHGLAGEEGRAGSAPCNLYFYGTGADGQEQLLVQHTTAIDQGDQLVFTLSGGNLERNVLSMEQFQGYVIASCAFPGARGYAFMSDSFGGIADLGMGYLAPVISVDSQGRRAPLAGDAP